MTNPIKRVRRIISELIGVTHTVYRRVLNPYNAPLRDYNLTDYAFWDRARRGKAVGMELAGLLLAPVTSKIASWTMGKPPGVKAESPPTTEELTKWMYQEHPSILLAYKESLDLADSYLVINADLTTTIIPPNVIERIVDEDDFSTLIGYRIIERYPHPTISGKYQIIEDEYTAESRSRWIYNQGGAKGEPQVFPNLIGQIPIIHIANNKSPNEASGNPELEATVELLHRYNETLVAGHDGNIRQGRPTPAIDFKDQEALSTYWDEYSTKVTTTLPDGSTETYDTIPFSADELIASVGRFYYAQPGSFLGDTKILLTLLYFIFIEHAQVPEFVMGTAITGSKASAETQMPIWERFIWGKRSQARGWLIEMLDIVQSYMVVLRIIPRIEKTAIIWDALTGENGKLTIETLQWLLEQNLIDDATALKLAPIDIENVEETIKQAREENNDKEVERKAEDFQVLFQRELDKQDRVAANGN